MKARFLVYCILLSTFVILLLSTAVQATEYREVKAEEILKNITNGEEVNLTDCRIVGELDVSTIKLKNIQKPHFYKSLNKYDKETLISAGTYGNLSVIESNITIINSIFENRIIFSNVLFNSSANFKGTTFNSSATFSDATFNSYANFEETTFNSSVDFFAANFNSYADFSHATFNSDADFSHANFNSDAYFKETNFRWVATFSDATFNSSANFKRTTFNSYAAFYYSTFNSYAAFYYSTFNSDADFIGTTFNSDADFFSATFNSDADFFGATFNSSADFRGPQKSENIITDGKTCELFRSYYKSDARYEDADNIYYNYRKYAQETKSLISFSKWMDIISWITCGYGLRPLRTLYFGGLVIVFFSIIFVKGQGIYRLSNATEQNSILSFWDALYFSIATFTTVGSGDWYPRDKFRKWVTLEGMLGWIMLGIFMATLTAVMIRS